MNIQNIILELSISKLFNSIFLLKTVFVASRKKIQDNPRPCVMQDRLNTALKCYCLLAFKSVNHQSEILVN